MDKVYATNSFLLKKSHEIEHFEDIVYIHDLEKYDIRLSLNFDFETTNILQLEFL